MILLLPWIPLGAALAVLLTPRERHGVLRGIALASTAACFAIVLSLFFRLDPARAGYQFVHRFDWLPALGIHYQVGLDGINLTFCLLHALVSLAGAFMAVRIQDRLKDYLFFYLLLTGSIYGVFTALDLFLLYLFYEMTLIPLYPMIGIWGSKNKEYGAMKLTIYITAGAVLALFGILMLYRHLGMESFDLIGIQEKLKGMPLSNHFQHLTAPFFLIGFGVIASLGLPGFSNFAAELLVFIGSWAKYRLLVALAVFGILITGIYLLRAVQNVCYGPVNPKWKNLKDAGSFAEKFPFILLLGALLVFGFWPQGLLRFIRPAVGALLP